MAEQPVQTVLNEAALRRVDPYVHQVLDVAKYVAVYLFENNNWHKTGIEGSLFLYARSAEPLFNILVLNRLNKNNLIEPVTQQMDVQLQEEFLLYKNNKGNIYGIWFFEKDDCPRITNLIQKVMVNSTTGNKRQAVSTQEGQNVDIFKMLTKAQEAYAHAKDGQPIPQQPRQSPLHIDGTPKSVADFFAIAGSAPHSNKIPIDSGMMAQSKRISESEKTPILQQLMSNPFHSVEHIEKQQRAVTPLSAEPNKVLSNPINQQIGFFASENGLAKRPQKIERSQHGIPPAMFPTPASIENGLKHVKIENTNNGLPPARRVSSPPGFSSGLTEDKKPDLMPPAMFTPREPILCVPRQPEPLTRNQLFQALDYLLRNDSDFMTKLHEAYVKSLTDKIL